MSTYQTKPEILQMVRVTSMTIVLSPSQSQTEDAMPNVIENNFLLRIIIKY